MKREIIPSALGEFMQITQDYQINDEVDAWCRQIVGSANQKGRPLSEVSIEEVFAELKEANLMSGSDWSRSWQKFREAGWMEKIKALRALLIHRTPPWRLRVNSHIFPGLHGAVRVEVMATYDINLAAGIVTFAKFESYAPSSDVETGSRAW